MITTCPENLALHELARLLDNPGDHLGRNMVAVAACGAW